MRRTGAAILSLVVTACAAASVADTTVTTAAPSTTGTPPTTTTTEPPTTTTTQYEVEVEGTDPRLEEMVTRLYNVSLGGSPPDAPEEIVEAFAEAEGTPSASGTAQVADWDEDVKLAVVEVGEDVTLAVADPGWRVLGGWWPSVGIPAHLGGFPKIVAVVGSDARPGENRERTRADSIHFVGLDGEGNAGIVGVPRDSWTAIPGAGNSKINASLAYGGPEMMMDAFTELTDLDFDGYLLTGFAGFEGLISVLGGLAMDVPRTFNDRAAKAYIQAGEQVLSAAEALALSRTRKTLPGGDFQRQEHGGLVMMAAQAMVRANGVGALPDMLANSRTHVSTDLYPGEMLVLAAAITRVDPDNVVNVVAPGGVGSAGAASVVFLRDSASEVWADLADGRLDEPAD